MTYVDILNKAWDAHLQPKADNAPTVISLFAGCGGSSLGYSMAGFKELLAVEWDNNAVECFKKNFHDVPVYHGDIKDLTTEKLFELTTLTGSGQLDVLDGSPPCQGFSTSGKRLLDDDRNFLFKEFVRILEITKPKVFVMENVAGMVKGKMKLVFVEILKTLKACGYNVTCKLLNAKYFNVPQSRQRLIFIGCLEGVPVFPKVISNDIIFKDATRYVKEDFETRELTPVVMKYGKVHIGGWSTDQKKYRKIKGNISGCMSLKWADYEKIVGTLIKKEISLTGVVHPDKKRYLSLSEYKRCGSFPDQYEFIGGRSKGVERIGNSVPPLMMREIAETIKASMLNGTL